MFAKQRHRSFVVPLTRADLTHIGSAALGPVVAIPLVGILFLIRAPLVLPSISVAALASATMIALAAWWTSSDRDSRDVSLWDVSGVCAFIGFAAGTISDPQELVEFFSLRAEVPAPPR